MANRLVQNATQLKNNEITKKIMTRLLQNYFRRILTKNYRKIISSSVKHFKNNLPKDDLVLSKLIGDKSSKQAADELISKI